MSEKSLGLNGLGKIRKNKTFRPERIEPKVSETIRRSLPDDQILMHYTRKLKAKDTPKSVQTQIDTHMAIKQIGIVENKKNYEVINELVEKYINDMPDTKKKLVMEFVRQVQRNMPEEWWLFFYRIIDI